MRRDDWLIHQLPVGMVENEDGENNVAEDNFLVRFLTIFQQMGDTVVQQVDSLHHVFDPTVAPPEMVRAMAEWLGVDWVDSSMDSRRQREIVLRYSELIGWRGTRRGLRALLELLGGGEVTVEDSGGIFQRGESPRRPAHVHLTMASPGNYTVGDLIRIIRAELPASVSFDLEIAGRLVWPPPPGAAIPDVEPVAPEPVAVPHLSDEPANV